MSFEEFLKAAHAILERLERIEAQNVRLENMLRAKGNGLERPVYDATGLQELGYSKDEAYTILRSYGNKRNGRLRVTWDQLLDYQQAFLN